MKNRKVVFANQKGGVGKSTLCILFANYLAWKKQDVCHRYGLAEDDQDAAQERPRALPRC